MATFEIRTAQTMREAMTFLFCVTLCCTAFGQDERIRPGKGLSFEPGQIAEYSNIEYDGETKRSFPSEMLFVLGKEGKHDAVQAVFVQDGEVIAAHTLLYDLSKERPENGELLESGKETLTIDGKDFACTWERRKIKDGILKTWTSPDIDFEPGARAELQLDNGKKFVTELILLGPSSPLTKKEKAFKAFFDKLGSDEDKNDKL